ncbi:TPA: hypothetical protein ACQUH6_000701 [Neisseria polysaccharea]|uniref:hypothetical protein n=1 Tax=Neisseria polysaccharea TaxID=489 RepID=UPI0027DECE19|nr:hypothetical protein [Neisseria polysaccharea]
MPSEQPSDGISISASAAVSPFSPTVILWITPCRLPGKRGLQPMAGKRSPTLQALPPYRDTHCKLIV